MVRIIIIKFHFLVQSPKSTSHICINTSFIHLFVPLNMRNQIMDYPSKHHSYDLCGMVCLPSSSISSSMVGLWNFPTYHYISLVGGLVAILYFPIQLGMSSSQLTNSYFSEGWPNHQPDHMDMLWVKKLYYYIVIFIYIYIHITRSYVHIH